MCIKSIGVILKYSLMLDLWSTITHDKRIAEKTNKIITNKHTSIGS